MTLFAVLGSPIKHSLSPMLHRAVFADLGVEWEYRAHEVKQGELATFLASSEPQLRGASVTMPLKAELAALPSNRTRAVEVTGVANTLVRDAQNLLTVDNTDAPAIAQLLLAEPGDSAAGLATSEHGSVVVLGAGATARSALLALHQLGITNVTICSRTPPAFEFREVLSTLGMSMRELSLHELSTGELSQHADSESTRIQVVINTLPIHSIGTPDDTGRPVLDVESIEVLARAALVLESAYGAEPTLLQKACDTTGTRYIPGIAMLLEQAILQSEQFVAAAGMSVEQDRIRQVMTRALTEAHTS